MKQFLSKKQITKLFKSLLYKDVIDYFYWNIYINSFNLYVDCDKNVLDSFYITQEQNSIVYQFDKNENNEFYLDSIHKRRDLPTLMGLILLKDGAVYIETFCYSVELIDFTPTNGRRIFRECLQIILKTKRDLLDKLKCKCCFSKD
jgi:hypothetical protein